MVAPSEARERGRRRAQHFDDPVARSVVSTRGGCKCLSRLAGIGFGASMNAYTHEAGEGRIPDLASSSDLGSVEALVVVLRGETDRGVVGLIGLQDHFAGRFCASRPSRDLREQLKGTLRCTEIRKRQALVGENDTDQGHPCDVVPLGHHLRTDHDIDLAIAETVENFLDARAGGRIAVEPRYLGFRKTPGDGLLELFGANAEAVILRSPTRHTWHSNCPLEIAVMTAKRTLSSVFGQGDATRRTLGYGATRDTTHTRRETASVEKQNGLVTGFQTLLEAMMKRARKQSVSSWPLTVPS